MSTHNVCFHGEIRKHENFTVGWEGAEKCALSGAMDQSIHYAFTGLQRIQEFL